MHTKKTIYNGPNDIAAILPHNGGGANQITQTTTKLGVGLLQTYQRDKELEILSDVLAQSEAAAAAVVPQVLHALARRRHARLAGRRAGTRAFLFLLLLLFFPVGTAASLAISILLHEKCCGGGRSF